LYGGERKLVLCLLLLLLFLLLLLQPSSRARPMTPPVQAAPHEPRHKTDALLRERCTVEPQQQQQQRAPEIREQRCFVLGFFK
jgi:hypothetical protein